jgi:hypothetical protein
MRARAAALHPYTRGVRDALAVFLLVCIRGLLLWIALPLAFLVWLVRLPYGVLTRRRAGFGAVAGWFDLNLIAAIERSLLAPIATTRQEFVPWRDLADVEHRVHWTDPA